MTIPGPISRRVSKPRARMFTRGLKVSGLTLVALLILSGCFQMNIDMKVKSNDRVDGIFLVGVSEQLLTLSGKSRADAIKDLKAQVDKAKKDIPKGTTAQFYDKGGFVGQRIDMKDLPAADFQKAAAQATAMASSTLGDAPGTGIKLVKVKGRWEFGGTLDLTALGSTGGAPPSGIADQLGKPQVSIKVTFPGKIVSKDRWAKVSGNTASWSPKVGEKVVMKIVAKAS